MMHLGMKCFSELLVDSNIVSYTPVLYLWDGSSCRFNSLLEVKRSDNGTISRSNTTSQTFPAENAHYLYR